MNINVINRRYAIGLSILAIFCSVEAASASPFATEIYATSGNFDKKHLYGDPNAMLGKPTTRAKNQFRWGNSGPTYRTKIIEPAHNVDLKGNKTLTTIKKNQWVIVKFDHKIKDDPKNPYGIDFIVFGNAFLGGGGASDKTNMNTRNVKGIFSESVTVSVSPGYQGLAGEKKNDHTTWKWYTYTNPKADSYFPTQAYHWDPKNARWTDKEMDFTKPVDPALKAKIESGKMTAAEVIKAYKGSGGGTGFDLKESGFKSIQYIKVSGSGEVDAFADVSAAPEPATIGLLAVGGIALLRRRRKRK